MPELEQDPEAFDPRSRRLCSDGTCIGVIGPDGRCKVCGLPDRGGPVAASPVASDPDDQDEDDLPAEAPGSGFDPGRKLCSDGSCIGVIAADGRCTECGRTAEA